MPKRKYRPNRGKKSERLQQALLGATNPEAEKKIRLIFGEKQI